MARKVLERHPSRARHTLLVRSAHSRKAWPSKSSLAVAIVLHQRWCCADVAKMERENWKHRNQTCKKINKAKCSMDNMLAMFRRLCSHSGTLSRCCGCCSCPDGTGRSARGRLC